MVVTPYLGLIVWNLTEDPYDRTQLALNWDRIDIHDHSNGKGKQIPTAGMVDGAITYAKLDPDLRALLDI